MAGHDLFAGQGRDGLCFGKLMHTTGLSMISFAQKASARSIRLRQSDMCSTGIRLTRELMMNPHSIRDASPETRPG
jgi:hypothetical protein